LLLRLRLLLRLLHLLRKCIECSALRRSLLLLGRWLRRRLDHSGAALLLLARLR
jgi:hypothetical protein